MRSPLQDNPERGSVTAEFAAALPAVLLGLALCLAAVQAAAQQVRLVDAAAASARLLGRGDAPQPLANGESRTIDREGGMLCVRVSAPSGALGIAWLGVNVVARSCALDEREWSAVGDSE